MSHLTLESLEQRVAMLEREMAVLSKFQSQAKPWKDRRQAIGQFTANELSQEVDAAGREVREADRQQKAT